MGGGGQIDPLWLNIVCLSSGDAPNGLIFHDFVPLNIRKVLGRPFLGFLFEISNKFYVDNFFHIQSKKGGNPSMHVKMHQFFCPFLSQKW